MQLQSARVVLLSAQVMLGRLQSAQVVPPLPLFPLARGDRELSQDSRLAVLPATSRIKHQLCYGAIGVRRNDTRAAHALCSQDRTPFWLWSRSYPTFNL